MGRSHNINYESKTKKKKIKQEKLKQLYNTLMDGFKRNWDLLEESS